MNDDEKNPSADGEEKSEGASQESSESKPENEEVEKEVSEEEKAEEKAVEEKAIEETKETEVKEEEKKEEPKAEQPKSEEPKKEVKVSGKLSDIIKDIESLSVLELTDLVKALEQKFGVTAAAPMAVAAPTGGTGAGEEAAEEQTTFNVVLAEAGANKIGVIKAVREVVPTLGLKEAEDLVEAAPKPVVEGVNKETANEAKSKLEAAGAKVELQ